MNKNFKDWFTEKNDLNENKVRAFFHEREVWFSSVGVNIGFEQDGKHEKFFAASSHCKKIQ